MLKHICDQEQKDIMLLYCTINQSDDSRDKQNEYPF